MDRDPCRENALRLLLWLIDHPEVELLFRSAADPFPAELSQGLSKLEQAGFYEAMLVLLWMNRDLRNVDRGVRDLAGRILTHAWQSFGADRFLRSLRDAVCLPDP